MSCLLLLTPDNNHHVFVAHPSLIAQPREKLVIELPPFIRLADPRKNVYMMSYLLQLTHGKHVIAHVAGRYFD